MPTTESRGTAVRAYFEWLAGCAPHISRQLRGPAGEADLDALQARLGLSLPAQLRSLYGLHDGQELTVGLGAVYGLEFLTVREVGDAWNEWREVRDDPGYNPDDFDPHEDVFVPGVVRKAYTTPGWVPLFRLPGGNDYFGVDLNPAESGTYGQVINFGRDEPKKYAAAVGLEPFFATLLQWGRAESAGDDPADVEGHVEDLFGHGGLVFERFHAQASDQPIELTAVEEDDAPADPPIYVPPLEFAGEYRALLSDIEEYLTGLGRMTRCARCRVSRQGNITTGGFSIWRLDEWSYAGTHQISKRYAALLDRAESLGLPPRVEIWFWRHGDVWTPDVHALCTDDGD